MRLGGVGGFRAGVALVDIGQVDALAGGGLHGLSQPTKLGLIVCAGRRHVQRQQMAQRVDCQMQLGALLALGPVIACPRAALWRGTEGAAVQDGSTGLGFAPSGNPQHGAQILG